MNRPALSLVLGATFSVALSVALSTSLSGCNSKTDASAKNFGITVTQYYDKKGDQCLEPMNWPVDVYETDLRQQKLYPDGVAGQMAALEAAGLAKGTDMELPGTFVDGKPNGLKVKVRHYALLDAAKPFLHEAPAQQSRLCWAHKTLDKVVRWADPSKVGDHQETTVLYTYKLDKLADWAKKPQVHEAFPMLGALVEGQHSHQEKLHVKSTPQGWEAFGLND